MRLSNFVSSATFRLGLLSSTVFVCSITIVFGLTYLSTVSALVGQLDNAIVSELSELSQQAQAKDIEAIIEAVDLRIRDKAGTETYYTLVDRQNRVLATNLPPIAMVSGWSEVQLPSDPDRGGEPGPLVRYGAQEITGGAYLAVGRDVSEVDEIRRVFVQSFLICVGATIALTLAGSIVFAGRVLGRIEAINRATREIIQGDLTRRVPTTGRDREFDELASGLNAMLDRITTLMGQIRQVTDDLAHDLRTPLARLRQRLYLARRKADSVADYENAVDGAIDEADAIIATFASLLRIAQIESGGRRATFSTFLLSDIAESLVEIYAPVAEDLGRSFHAQIEPGVAIHGDRELLNQLFVNLIENALNHTPLGADIRLRVGAGLDGAATAELIDHGPGIPAGMRDQVFKRFVRLDKSRSTAGSGLGLSLVAAIAELHEACVELHDAFPGDTSPGLRVVVRFGASTTQ